MQMDYKKAVLSHTTDQFTNQLFGGVEMLGRITVRVWVFKFKTDKNIISRSN